MLQSSSSISSSDLADGIELIEASQPTRNIAARVSPVRDAIVVGAWMILFLVIADIAINRLFPYPSDTQRQPTNLQAYFNYGRSTEAKLRWMIRSSDESTGPLAFAGWIKNRPAKYPNPVPQKTRVSMYGMSFSNHIGNAMAEIDPDIALDLYSGPDAPPNHSLAQYQIERGTDTSEAVVIAILASGVRGLGTMSGFTWQYEAPAPFTYPVYSIADEKLQCTWPTIRSLADIRSALMDPNDSRWQSFLSELSQDDRFYDSFMIHHTPLDSSSIVRLIRRAYAQRHIRSVSKTIETDPQTPKLLAAMMQEFAESAKHDGRRPIVLLIQDHTSNFDLKKNLVPELQARHINFLDTSAIVSPKDPANFIFDGHFQPEGNRQIARALLKMIHS